MLDILFWSNLFPRENKIDLRGALCGGFEAEGGWWRALFMGGGKWEAWFKVLFYKVY